MYFILELHQSYVNLNNNTLICVSCYWWVGGYCACKWYET